MPKTKTTERVNRRWPALTHEEKRKLLHMRERGMRPSDIARATGINQRCIYHWTQDAAVKRGEKRAKIKVSAELHPLVEHLYNEVMDGPPMYIVALKAEVYPQTLSRWFRGEITPRLKEIEKVLNLLDLEVKWTVTKKTSARPASPGSGEPTSF